MNASRIAIHAAVIVAFALSGCGMLKPKPKKNFGETCSNALDCESMKCNIERGGICTKECHSDGDCTGGDYVCAGDPTGTGASCAKKTGSATGSNCHDRAECDHGSCLHKGEDENGFCSQRCISSNDCPAGYKVCMKIDDMGAQKLCLPGNDASSTPPKVGVKKPGGATPPGSGRPPAPTPPAATPPAGGPPGGRPPGATPTPKK